MEWSGNSKALVHELVLHLTLGQEVEDVVAFVVGFVLALSQWRPHAAVSE